ncbi:MAG: ABC transporter ATP-binding protein [Armatimonadetes bacterium]|nr:ABC transporter ATP-binding protein [Armatimonadota bacterium]
MTPVAASARAQADRTGGVHARGLGKRFGDFWAVKQVNLDVEPGEVVGLLGPNGAGKSTTLRMMCGLLSPTEGKVTVAGLDPARNPLAVKARIGYMTQHFSLYGDLTVEENVRFYGAAYGLRGAELDEAVGRWLSELELEAWRDRATGKLPPGWTRRAAFACAVIAGPPVLLLDEPTSGVDAETSDLLWHLAALEAEQGVAVLVTTHWMAEAERCDRVLIIAAGQVVGEGTPQELPAALRGRILGLRAEPLGVALAALKSWPASRAVAIAGQWITVELPGPAAEAADDARQVVEAAGARVMETREMEPTLDDVFAHLVTRPGKAAAAEGGS